MRRIFLACALLSLAASGGWAAKKAQGKSFARCGGWACSLTAIEMRGVNTKEAWALGRTTKRDAEEECQFREGPEIRKCVNELVARPPVVITADCEEGTASFYGADDYKLSEKAKKGELPHADDPAFWQTEMTHRARYTVITWFNLLCPKASAKWHIQQEQ